MSEKVYKFDHYKTLWSISGPIAVVFVVLISSMSTIPTSASLVFAGLIGVVLSALLKKTGWMVSLLLVGAAVLFNLFSVPAMQQVWMFSVALAFCAASFLTYVTFAEIEESLVQHSGGSDLQKTVVRNLREKQRVTESENQRLKEEVTFLQDQKVSLQKQLQQESEVKSRQIADLEQVILKMSPSTQQSNDADLLNELDELKRQMEEFQEIARNEENKLYEQIQNITAELDAVAKEKQVLEGTISHLYSENESLKGHQDYQKEELHAEIAELKSAQENANQHAKEEKMRALELEIHYKALLDDQEKLQTAKVEKLLLEKGEQEKKMALYQEQLSLLKQENEELQQQKVALANSHDKEKQESQKLLEREQAYQEEKSLLEQKISGLIAQNEDFKSKLESIALEEANVPENQHREIRKYEGLYKQMRDQFEEKCDLLHTTRKELFKAQEQLEALQRQYEDVKLEQFNEAEKYFCHMLSENEREMNEYKEQYETEIDGLKNIVDEWMRVK